MDPVDPKNGSFARCSKHPSQLFTGFCSYCLVEKLSSVGSSDTSSTATSSSQSEIVETTTPDEEKKPCQVGSRKTLLSLFQMDDNEKNVTNVWSSEHEHESRSVDCAKTIHLEASLDITARDSWSHPDASGNGASDSHVETKSKGRGISFRWSSALLRKGLRNGTGDDHKRNQSLDKVLHDGGENKQLERKPSLRMYYCDWMVCCESSRSSWELPRHSWDGSMVSKALSCSFGCLEEQQDDLRRTTGSMREEPTSENLEKVGNGNSNGETSADERSLSSEGSSLGSLFRDRSHDESHPEICRKKSRGWSKVWDRSITSPLSDFVKKGESVLERSLSESWKGTRKSKRIGAMKADCKMQVKKNGLTSARENPCAERRINATNWRMQNLRPDFPKKRESMFGRSRSVHYSSPANLDNGLLRFYLTPLRSSRSTNRGRRKASHLFARGLFGLY